jgi:multiple sugar transport system ATP-binding protein
MNESPDGIRYVQVGLVFGKAPVLRGIDLHISAGKLVAILGPSGCGKTTLLRLTAGLLSSSSGAIFFGNEDQKGIPPQDRDVGFVFQDLSVYPHFTVEKNLAFSLRRLKLPKGERDARVRRVAEELGITNLLGVYPSDLSGGERQRVALGRALVRQPKILLMDEPLSQLDAHLRSRLRNLFLALHTRLGATTLYVTHDASEALAIADDIVLMRDGRIVQVGSPEEVYEHPNSQWVAEFLSDPPMNFIELDDHDGRLRSGLHDWNLSHGQVPMDGLPVVAGFRPAAVQFMADEQDDPMRSMRGLKMQAVVKRRYRMGDRIVVSLEVDEQRIEAIVPLKAKVEVGRRIQCGVPSEAIMWFDRNTGERLPHGQSPKI